MSDAAAAAQGEVMATLRAELDADLPMRLVNARHIFQTLCAVEEAITAPSASSLEWSECSSAVLQRRRTVIRSLSADQQDALMEVLYACMDPSVAAQQDEEKICLPAVYAWHAALYEVTGDGAVMRVLARRR